MDHGSGRLFENLLSAAAGGGGAIEWKLTRPKHEFLAWAVEQCGLLLHGTNDRTLSELRAAEQTDAVGARVRGVFASPDPLWPLFYAITDHADARPIRSGCMHVRTRDRIRRLYFFSVREGAERPWREGAVYLVPRESFRPGPWEAEWISSASVKPLARLDVGPEDFPFLDAVLRHPPGERLLPFAWRRLYRQRKPAGGSTQPQE